MKYIDVEGKSKKEVLQKIRKTYGEEAFIWNESERKAKGVVAKLTNKKEFVYRIAVPEKKTGSRSESLRQLSEMLRLKSEGAELSGQTMEKKNPSDVSRLTKTIYPTQSASQDPYIVREIIPRPEEKLAYPDYKSLPVRESFPPDKIETKDHTGRENIQVLEKDIKAILDYLKENKEPVVKEDTDFQEISTVLREQMFTESWILECMEEMKRRIPRNEWKNRKVQEKNLAEFLSLRIKVAPSLHSKIIITLIGPTGSGKTTTIAKLAKKIKFDNGMSVMLVTMDNYRIAATEQLKVYGNIMEIPVKMVKNKGELETLINESRYDRIVIDTPGFSPANEDLMTRLLEITRDHSGSMDKHLVIPANMKKDDIVKNIERFSVFHTDKIIISKIDETSTIGYILEVAEEWNYPISFVTNGQRVPEDIMEAQKSALSEMIVSKIKWER